MDTKSLRPPHRFTDGVSIDIVHENGSGTDENVVDWFYEGNDLIVEYADDRDNTTYHCGNVVEIRDDHQQDHYYTDDDGDLWVNISNTDSILLDLIDNGEITIDVTQVAVCKETGELVGIVTESGQETIDQHIEAMNQNRFQFGNVTSSK